MRVWVLVAVIALIGSISAAPNAPPMQDDASFFSQNTDLDIGHTSVVVAVTDRTRFILTANNMPTVEAVASSASAREGNSATVTGRTALTPMFWFGTHGFTAYALDMAATNKEMVRRVQDRFNLVDHAPGALPTLV